MTTGIVRDRSEKLGFPPGSLIFVGEQKTDNVVLTVSNYDVEHFEEKTAASIEDCLSYRDLPSTTWIHVCGLHRPDIIESLGSCYGIHHLFLEDILNTAQRPKMEDLEDGLFIVMKAFTLSGDETTAAEQVSFILGENYVISLQEGNDDIFEPVRSRLRSSRGRIRSLGPDYLLYALMDTVVDHYFSVLEVLGERIGVLEDELLVDHTQETMPQIHRLRRELLFLKKTIWPLREVISAMLRSETGLIRQTTQFYIRDLYDHVIQVVDSLENYRELTSALLEIYLSSVSNRMNEVMKVLTIIATIFIPITFIAGVYGMNFEFMPELKWRWGYALVWGVMIAMIVAMLNYFRKKKWL
ncbi:MAG: magnesium/cobalt transporter CorA [Proteobacteria bacterium]|nr:magnesium/cobalt transporter CorA [Pseudomonadota bacterium]MBU1571402.1 magnesium/cobalt transporter CorA [Pseudomonadota bacterium]